MFSRKKGFVVTEHDGGPVTVAHADAPGYETYSTGWYSVILQRLR